MLVFVALSVPLMLCVKPCAYAFCCPPHHDKHEDFDNIEAGAEPGANEVDQLIDTGDKEAKDKDDVANYEALLNAETGI
jgi:hypothetical protein